MRQKIVLTKAHASPDFARWDEILWGWTLPPYGIVRAQKCWCEVKKHEILNNINFKLEWTSWSMGTRRVLILKTCKMTHFMYFASFYRICALQEDHSYIAFSTMLNETTTNSLISSYHENFFLILIFGTFQGGGGPRKKC